METGILLGLYEDYYQEPLLHPLLSRVKETGPHALRELRIGSLHQSCLAPLLIWSLGLRASGLGFRVRCFLSQMRRLVGDCQKRDIDQPAYRHPLYGPNQNHLIEGSGSRATPPVICKRGSGFEA